MSSTQTLADVIGIQPNRWISSLQVAYMRAVGDRAMGRDPLGHGDCGWPSEPPSAPVSGMVPILGWRFWAPHESGRLLGPFVAAQPGVKVSTPGVAWQPGSNEANHTGYTRTDLLGYPRPECSCGFRILRSLTALRAVATVSAQRTGLAGGGLPAFAQVLAWGRVVPGDPGDDWRYTLRVQHARVVGPLHLDSSQAEIADRLSARYEVPVNLGSGPAWLDSIRGVTPEE